MICGGLTIFTIFVSIGTAVNGMEISALDKKESSLISKKKDLENELAKLDSIRSLTDKVSDMEFVKSSDIVYVNLVKPVAQVR